MKTGATLALLLSICAGCTDQDMDTAPTNIAAGTVIESGAALPERATTDTIGNGQWLVTAINGQTPPREPQILLQIDGETISAQSQCVSWQWSHAVQDDGFAAAWLPRMGITESDGMISPAMCARALTREETAFGKAIDTGHEISRTSPTVVEIKGPDARIRLERQPGPGQKIPLVGKLSLAGDWRISAIDGQPATTSLNPIQMNFDAAHAETVSDCLRWFWVYQAAGNRIAISVRPLLLAICDRGPSAFEKTVISRIETSHTLNHTADGNMTLSGDKGSLTLTPNSNR